MNKLFKLKKWVSLADAAKRLSATLGEDVSEADILRLALDGHLKLSVHLVNGAEASPCVPVKLEEIEWKEIQSLDGLRTLRLPIGGRVWADDSGVFQVRKVITELESGIWDLPMTGGERIDVEFAYQQLVNGPEISTVTLEGVFVASEKGDLYEIQFRPEGSRDPKETDWKQAFSHDRYHAAGALPKDSVFVVRTAALQEFEQSVSETPDPTGKPLSTRERDTLLTIIAVLAKEAKINIDAHGKSAGYIEGLTDQLGVPVSKRAIEEHLKKIPAALRGRMK